jgi:uncharacterized repeat protein (TIGR03803 family)
MKKVYLLSVLFCLTGITTIAQFSVIHHFNDTAGGVPLSNLTIIGKTLFGVTLQGGASDSGCLFSVDTNGNNYRDLHDFNHRNTNGCNPFAVTLQVSGKKLIGTTEFGGANDSGSVFSIDTSGANYKDLLDFNGANGSEPLAGVVLIGGQLFGMTYQGGANQYGVIFSVDTNGTNYKKLCDFNGATGANPYGVVTIVGHKLYGMTSYGGANGMGNIFSLDSNGNNYTDLFDFTGANGQYPNNLLVLSRNELFGMTYSGGAGTLGNVFSIDTNGGNFNDLLDLQGTTTPFGSNPAGDVILRRGVLYGMTTAGGVSDSGAIFSLDTNGSNYADIHDFTGPDGSGPYANVTIAGNTMYGTTQVGGTYHYGVIFKMTIPPPAGVNNIINPAYAKVYPNPSNGVFTVEVNSENLKANRVVEVYNVLGEKILSSVLNIQNPKFNIDLSGQPEGIYYYRILDNTGSLLSEGKLSIVK